MPRGHCFTGLGGGTFNPDCQALPRCPTAPLFGGHAPTRLDRQSAGGEAVRLDGMKRPIIPPSRCQQAAVPQRKAAHFEQYRHFIPPLLLLSLSSNDAALLPSNAPATAQCLSLQTRLHNELWTAFYCHGSIGILAKRKIICGVNKFFCLVFSAAFLSKKRSKMQKSYSLSPATSLGTMYKCLISQSHGSNSCGVWRCGGRKHSVWASELGRKWI